LHFTEAENAQAAEVENTVAEKLEQESPEVEGALQGLIAELETYLDALEKEHAEHFEGLRNRLEKCVEGCSSATEVIKPLQRQ